MRLVDECMMKEKRHKKLVIACYISLIYLVIHASTSPDHFTLRRGSGYHTTDFCPIESPDCGDHYLALSIDG